jgi:Xaa-Pro aminopeptidase
MTMILSLKAVRQIMAKELKIDAFLVGTADAHQSEYVCDHDGRREFITGFTGSAGTALITSTEAYLWTDCRYFIQAEKELCSDWTLMKSGNKGVLEPNEWIAANMPQNSVVGIDPSLVATNQATAMQTALKQKSMVLKTVIENPVDKVQ